MWPWIFSETVWKWFPGKSCLTFPFSFETDLSTWITKHCATSEVSLLTPDQAEPKFGNCLVWSCFYITILSPWLKLSLRELATFFLLGVKKHTLHLLKNHILFTKGTSGSISVWNRCVMSNLVGKGEKMLRKCQSLVSKYVRWWWRLCGVKAKRAAIY